MLRKRRAWEAFTLLALIATWQLLTHRSEVPTPCPPAVKIHHQALSQHLRETESFRQWGAAYGREGEWVVVRYTVTAQGHLTDIELDKSSGPNSHFELVLAGVKQCRPVPPLPEGIKSLEVVELFWGLGKPNLRSGSLEHALIELQEDGRWIRLQR